MVVPMHARRRNEAHLCAEFAQAEFAQQDGSGSSGRVKQQH
jgi:hypothetical protein